MTKIWCLKITLENHLNLATLELIVVSLVSTKPKLYLVFKGMPYEIRILIKVKTILKGRKMLSLWGKGEMRMWQVRISSFWAICSSKGMTHRTSFSGLEATRAWISSFPHTSVSSFARRRGQKLTLFWQGPKNWLSKPHALLTPL